MRYKLQDTSKETRDTCDELRNEFKVAPAALADDSTVQYLDSSMCSLHWERGWDAS